MNAAKADQTQHCKCTGQSCASRPGGPIEHAVQFPVGPAAGEESVIQVMTPTHSLCGNQGHFHTEDDSQLVDVTHQDKKSNGVGKGKMTLRKGPRAETVERVAMAGTLPSSCPTTVLTAWRPTASNAATASSTTTSCSHHNRMSRNWLQVDSESTDPEFDS